MGPEVFYRAGVARRAVPHRDAMRRVKVNRLESFERSRLPCGAGGGI